MGIERLNGESVKEILLLPYSHHDYEWCCTRAWHKWRYIKCYCDVLDRLNENPDFTWCIDNVVHSWVPFKEYCPDRVDEFVRRVQEGRICILNGGVSLARPSRVSEETYIRNMIEGKRYFREQFGVDDFPVLYNADTASGHSQLPQIVDLGGQKYYRFQRPDNLLTKKGVPTQLWWKGLDGTQILVTRGIYGGFWDNNDWLNLDADTAWEEKRQAFFDTTLQDKVIDNLKSDTVLQFVGCDDCRPMLDIHDRPIKLNEFIAEWNEREPVKMRYATPNEAYDVLSQKDLPVWEGALDHAELTYDIPIKGEQSMWRMRIALDRLITRCEKLAVLAKGLGMPYPEAEIRALWYDLFEITGHAIEWIQEKDNDELYTIAQSARYRAQVLARKTAEYIVNAVKQDSDLQAVAINLNNWDVEQVVCFQVTDYKGVTGFDILDAEGHILPYQIYDHFHEYRKFENSEYAGVEVLVRVKVPAMGYTTLKMVPNGEKLADAVASTFIDHLPSGLPADAPDTVTMDNEALEVTFFRGTLLSMKNKKTGKEIRSKADAPVACLRFIELTPASSWLSNFNDIVKTWDFVPESWKVLGNGPVQYVYKVTGRVAGEPAAVTYTLHQGSKGMDLEVETDFAKAIEGILVYQFAVDEGSDVYADIPFGTEKRAFFDDICVDPITNEPVALAPAEWDYPGQIYARNWCSFLSSRAPVAIVSKDCESYYNYIRPQNAMHLFLNRHMPLKYRTDRWVGECPPSFDGTGHNAYRFSFMFAEKLGKSSDIQRYHKEQIYPAEAMQKFGFVGSGHGPQEQSLFATDKKNIICTAVYQEKGQTFARFFECDGVRTEVTFPLPEGTKKVRAVDFEGNLRPEVKTYFSRVKNTVKVTFEPYKIVTLALK